MQEGVGDIKEGFFAGGFLQEGVGDVEFEVFAQRPGSGGFDSAAQEAPETKYKFRSSEHVRKS